MADRSTLNKLYFEILLSKNKLPLLQTYYSNIKNEILTSLTDLHNLVTSTQSWVQSQISYLNTTRTEQATTVNNFVASSSDNLIVSHKKYVEMMDRYKEYVSKFYSRIHSLENIGVANSYTVNNFISNEVGQLSSFWKFHYTDDYGNALPVEHKFCALNITSESVILEVSNSRYLYFTNENVIYDVDYVTKEVYLYYLNNKTLEYITENASFHTLFALTDKSKIYIYVINHRYENTNQIPDAGYTIIGDELDSNLGIYELICLEYNIVTHKLEYTQGATSSLYITGNLLRDYRLRLVDTNNVNGYYYLYIADYIIRVQIDSDISLERPIIQKAANELCDVVKFGDYFVFPLINDTHNNTRLVACKLTSGGSVDLANPTAYVVLNAFAENDPRFNTDSKIVKIFKSDNIGGYGTVGLYVVTNTNIWLITSITDTEINNIIDVELDKRKEAIGITDYNFVDNSDYYTIDEFGYLYILKDNTYLYCAKTDNNVVQAPTRYADKLINLQNVISANRAGYAFNKSDNITISQLGDTGNEEFIYSFVHKEDEKDAGVLYGITKTGKIAYCDIVTGEWNKDSVSKHCFASFTNDKEITAICTGETEDVLYVALANYVILRVTKAELIEKAGSNLTASNLVYNTMVGSRIKAMLYIDTFKTLYIATISGSVSVYDFNNDTYHTADVTSSDYVETDKSRYAITRGDDAIGNVSINCITTDGNNLIVMGASGRVASCSFSDFKWTPYKTSEENVSNYSSNIFYDGLYEKEPGVFATCRDIVSFVNYNNTKLIVFTIIGEIFSCNLSTGVWTDVTGKIILHGGSGFGPGIYNKGSILGGKTPLAVTRVGNIIYVTGESARLGSISINEAGITEYRGTSDGSTVGPGYAYSGEDVAETININSIVTDNRGKLFLLGSTNTVLTYSIESNEVIIPSNSKLYYIARRQSKYDFMSSLLVRVSKGELNEKVPLYPPSEDNDPVSSYVDSANYVFKNGRYVWKINTALDVVYFSDDNGVSYTTANNIKGTDNLPDSVSSVKYVSCIPNGYVTSDGKLIAVFNIDDNNTSFILVARSKDDVQWIKLADKITQKQIDSIIPTESVDNVYKFYDVGKCEKYILSGDENKPYDIKTLDRVNRFAGDFFVRGYDLCYKENVLIENIEYKLKYYVTQVIGDSYVEVSIDNLFITNNKDVNFIAVCDDARIYVITIHFNDLELADSEDNWNISFKKLDFDLIINEYAGKVTIDSIDVKYNTYGTKALALINFTVADNAFLKSKGRSVLVSLISDIYGEYAIPNYRIINEFDTYSKIVSYDPGFNKVYIAMYNTVDSTGMITHTNSVHSYRVLDSAVNTPIRALTNAWKSCQVVLNNGSDEFKPNAVALRLKMNCNGFSEQDIVSTQFTLRYKVLISDITNGKFILYETEKSVGMSKTDDDTRTVEPFFRVLAIDGFEDEIFELYTSKFDRYHKIDSSSDLSDLGTLGYSYDFMTFLQRFTGEGDATYQIKIKCENTIPANIDAAFYVEPYYQDATSKGSYENSISNSEYKTGVNSATINTVFGKNIGNYLVTATKNNKLSMIKSPVYVNDEYVPQLETDVQKVGINVDTYMSIVRGDGNGLFDKINCIIMAKDSDYVIVPLSKNKKDVRYVFDTNGSAGIVQRANSKVDTLRNGRSIHKMHNRSVFPKNTINNPDFYVDYKGKGRIVRVEGTLTNKFGIFEAISTIDGNQKRIKQISEVRDGTRWNNATSTYDAIKKREFGYGYDIVDRYSVFEEPYDMIKAWWIPARSLINKGNERLHNFTFDEGRNITVGRKYSSFDKIDNPTAIYTKPYSGGKNPVNHGINASINGITISSPNTVEAYTELIDEKFPLENWKGWEWAKMCFIRKWRKVFTDKHIEYKYEVEAPSRVEVGPNKVVSLQGSPIYVFDNMPYTDSDFNNPEVKAFIDSIKPSIDRQLYYYSDSIEKGIVEDPVNPNGGTGMGGVFAPNTVSESDPDNENPTVGEMSEEIRRRNEFEGISRETWRRGTAYYYTSHGWSCILDEIFSLDHQDFFKNDEKDDYRELNNFAQLSDEEFAKVIGETINVSRRWYVTASTDSVNTDNLELRHYDSKYELDTQQSAPFMLDSNTDSTVLNFKGYPFPVPTVNDGEVVGERVVEVNVPIPEGVTKAQVSTSCKDWSTGVDTPGSAYISKWIRGIGSHITETATDNVMFGYVPASGYLDENKDPISSDELYKYIHVSEEDALSDEQKEDLRNCKRVVEIIYLRSNPSVHEECKIGMDNSFLLGRKTDQVKNYPTDNTYDFNYGQGRFDYSYGEAYIAENRETTNYTANNTITVKIRSYKSISKTDLTEHPELDGKFVAYEDKVYNISIDPELVTTSSDSTKINLTAGNTSVVDSYCGKGTLQYLVKNPLTLHIKNLIKNEGYTSVSTDLICWTITDGKILKDIQDEIIDNYDPDFSLTKYRDGNYNNELRFLTQDKDQTYSVNQVNDIVDRIFVRQIFEKENSSDESIQWTYYMDLGYIDTLSAYPERTINTYPQKYIFLDVVEKDTSVVLNSKVVDSAHCWLHITGGSSTNKNMKIISDSSDGLDSYVSGEFCYLWHDGTVKRIVFRVEDHITIQYLLDKGFISSYGVKTETVKRREDSDLFDKITTIEISGTNITHDHEYDDVTETTVLYASETVEYAEAVDLIGDNTSVANVVTWSAGSTGTGDPNGIGMEEEYDGEGIEKNETFDIKYNLTDMKVILSNTGVETSVGTDTMFKYNTYSVKIVANEGYKLPETISVRVGDDTGTVGSEYYSYTRDILAEPESYVKGYSTTIGSIVDEIIEAGTPVAPMNHEFVGYSLDGMNVITEEEKTTVLRANETVNIYTLFRNTVEARLVIYGDKVDGNVEITGNAGYVG